MNMIIAIHYYFLFLLFFNIIIAIINFTQHGYMQVSILFLGLATSFCMSVSCMRVCVHVCVHTQTHTHRHTHTHTHTHTNTHTHVCV